MSAAVRLGMVGGGWRAQYFLRLARLVPDRLELVGAAARSSETAARLATDWQVPAFVDVESLISSARPELVVVSIPRTATPAVIRSLVAAGIPVLTETPPAADEATLFRLWGEVGRSNLVQVAEQYPLYPGHRVRADLVGAGVIGAATSVHVSSTHDYHAVALIRRMLGVGRMPARVRAVVSAAPLVDPVSRVGWTSDLALRSATTILSTLEFDSGVGLYDFTDNQWHNPLRNRRILIRGSHGEIADDSVVRLVNGRTVVRSPIIRSSLGHDLELTGFDTEHLAFDGAIRWRNPFVGLRLSDEEIAVLECLVAAANWARGEAAGPYSFADAAHDALLGLAIRTSAKHGDRAILTPKTPWPT